MAKPTEEQIRQRAQEIWEETVGQSGGTRSSGIRLSVN
jgi:hypothetical protein